MTDGARASRGRRPLAGVWGCPPAHKGSPAGIAARWQEVWRVSPSAQGESSGDRPRWQEVWRVSASAQGESSGDRPLWQEVWRVSVSAPGESRGDRPLWQEVWRVSLSRNTYSPRDYLPPSLRAQRGNPGWGSGSPEGIAPSGRRSGGCPSRALLICPLPERKGARGMVRATNEAGLTLTRIWGGGAGVQRAPPSGRGLGVSPRKHIYSPLPTRKGARGMVPLRDQQQLADALPALERPVRLGCLR